MNCFNLGLNLGTPQIVLLYYTVYILRAKPLEKKEKEERKFNFPGAYNCSLAANFAKKSDKTEVQLGQTTAQCQFF